MNEGITSSLYVNMSKHKFDGREFSVTVESKLNINHHILRQIDLSSSPKVKWKAYPLAS